MDILKFIKDYWVQIVFLVGMISAFITLFKAYKRATLCSLRNDILEIWDKCKETESITRYQFECLIESSELYFKLGGDGFIHELVERIKSFKVKD